MVRTARVGQLIKRIVAESIEHLDDERLSLVSVTGVQVDRDLYRAVVWFSSLADSDETDGEIVEAFEEHAQRLRGRVSARTRLRKTPKLEFRPDTVLRSARRIEQLLNDINTSGSEAPLGSARRDSQV